MFDEFYNDIYSELFVKWIISRKNEYKRKGINCYISEQEYYFTTINFDAGQYTGEVSIWKDEVTIVEEKIFDEEGNLVFYLHFSLETIGQFRKLFTDFYNGLLKLLDLEENNIALVCNDGLSTSLFVEELLKVCKLQKLDYKITSVSLDRLRDENFNYDALYLAPQIAHLEPELMLECNNSVPIYRIDPTVFATKDYQAIIKEIQKNLKTD